jgi:hypothetical protein
MYVLIKNAIFWMLRRVAPVRTDVTEQRRFLQELHGVTS